MSKQMRSVTVKTNGYVTFPSSSRFMFAMHWNLKGTSHEDSHKIHTIVRVCIQTNWDQVRTSHESYVIIYWGENEVDERLVRIIIKKNVWWHNTDKKVNTFTKQTYLLAWHVVKKIAWMQYHIVWYCTMQIDMDTVRIGMQKIWWW